MKYMYTTADIVQWKSDDLNHNIVTPFLFVVTNLKTHTPI